MNAHARMRNQLCSEEKVEHLKVFFSANSWSIFSPSIVLKSRAPTASVQHTNKEKEGKTGKQKGKSPLDSREQ